MFNDLFQISFVKRLLFMEKRRNNLVIWLLKLRYIVKN